MFRRILTVALTGLVALGSLVAPARAAASGTVLGSYYGTDGIPIAGARVDVFSATGRYQGGDDTDTAGRFTVGGVTATTVKVRFIRGGLVQWAHQQPDQA